MKMSFVEIHAFKPIAKCKELFEMFLGGEKKNEREL